MQTRKKKWILPLSLAAIALLLRLLAIHEFGPSHLKFGDAADYLSASKSLCSTGAYPDRGSLPFFRAPGLPLFIAGATLCHTEAVWAVKVALAVTDTVSVLLIFLLAEQLFESWLTSFVAASAAAIYPFFIAQVSDVQTESLFMFFLLASVLSTLKGTERGDYRLLLLAGGCATAAALTRPVGLALIPLLVGFHLAIRPTHRVRVWLIAWFAIGAMIVLGPWVTRNALRYHEFIVVNDASGYNFWRGTSAEMDKIRGIEDPGAYSIASVQFETVTSPAIAQEIERLAGGPSKRSSEWYKRSLRSLEEAPASFAFRLLRNAMGYWRPWLNPQTYSPAMVIATGLLTTSLYVLAFIGWGTFRRRDRRLALWCAAAAILFWVLQIPFQVVSRFRIPITDPFLIVFAAATVTATKAKAEPRIGKLKSQEDRAYPERSVLPTDFA